APPLGEDTGARLHACEAPHPGAALRRTWAWSAAASRSERLARPRSPSRGREAAPRRKIWQGGVMADFEGETTIRPAVLGDAAAIAKVHIASWQEAYAGIVPAEILDNLDVQRREEQWRAHLQDAERESIRIWVAEREGEIVGFASFGPSRDEDADRHTWELYAIYLTPEAWGRGVARELMRTVLAQ